MVDRARADGEHGEREYACEVRCVRCESETKYVIRRRRVREGEKERKR